MKPKHLPRLWCALQGLLPFEACVVAQRGELAWPPEPAEPDTLPAARRAVHDGAGRAPRRRDRLAR